MRLRFGQKLFGVFFGLAAAVGGSLIVAAYIELRSLPMDLRWVILRQALVALGVALVVSMLLAWRMARRLNRPIKLLDEAMERVAAGDLETHVKRMRTGDEFDRLIRRFNQMVIGLRERQRMKDSLTIAGEIQQQLLPSAMPVLEGFEIFGGVRYCDEAGGDFYDFIELPGTPPRLGIAVGDVTGHGIGPALLMASARAALRSQAMLHVNDLSALMGAANSQLLRDARHGQFLTLFYAALEYHAGVRRMWWTSAGHEAALHFQRHTGEFRVMPGTGIPLGILPDERHESCGPVHLDAGDLVLIGTDGIRETRNPQGQMIPTERLAEVVRAAADRTAEAIYAAILQTVLEFRGAARQRDDLALVVVRCVA